MEPNDTPPHHNPHEPDDSAPNDATPDLSQPPKGFPDLPEWDADELTPLPDESRALLPGLDLGEPEEEDNGEDSDDGDDDETPELTPELTEEIHAAVEALFAEPFPERPYSLVPKGGERTPEFTDYIIHKDVESEHQCVFVFDSIVDAFAVAEEYQEATGREAEPIETDIYSLDEERFWVKFYRANGVVAILSLPDYKKQVGLSRDF